MIIYFILTNDAFSFTVELFCLGVSSLTYQTESQNQNFKNHHVIIHENIDISLPVHSISGYSAEKKINSLNLRSTQS